MLTVNPPTPTVSIFSNSAGGWGGVSGVGLATPLDRREVSNHSTAEHDAEPVGSLVSQHATGGEGDLERVVGGDDFGGFGIDDVVGHGGAN